jgi:hypothetical protein
MLSGAAMVVVTTTIVAIVRICFQPENPLDVARTALREVLSGKAATLSSHSDPNEARFLPVDQASTERLLRDFVLPTFGRCQKQGPPNESIDRSTGEATVTQFYLTPQGTKADIVMAARTTPNGVKMTVPIANLIFGAMQARNASLADEFPHEGWLRGERADRRQLEQLGYKGRFRGDQFLTWDQLDADLLHRISVLKARRSSKTTPSK